MYPLDHSFDPVSKEDVVDLNDQNQMLLYCYCLTESGYHALEEFDVAVSFIKGKVMIFVNFLRFNEGFISLAFVYLHTANFLSLKKHEKSLSFILSRTLSVVFRDKQD